MADENEGKVAFVLLIGKQIEYLGLHRNIKRRGRLVKQQNWRFEDERSGNSDALALPSRQFMRESIGERCR